MRSVRKLLDDIQFDQVRQKRKDREDAEEPETKSQKLLETVSVLETLPFDVFAQILLRDPIINLNLLSVNRKMRQKIQESVRLDGFFETAVKKCFPLVTKLPNDMGPANNRAWRLFFLRIFEAFGSLEFQDLDTAKDTPFSGLADKVLACSGVVGGEWIFKTTYDSSECMMDTALAYLRCESEGQTFTCEAIAEEPNTADLMRTLLSDATVTQKPDELELATNLAPFTVHSPTTPVLLNANLKKCIECKASFEVTPGPIGSAQISYTNVAVYVPMTIVPTEMVVTVRPNLFDDAAFAALFSQSGLPYTPPSQFFLETLVPV